MQTWSGSDLGGIPIHPVCELRPGGEADAPASNLDKNGIARFKSRSSSAEKPPGNPTVAKGFKTSVFCLSLMANDCNHKKMVVLNNNNEQQNEKS